MQTIVFPLPFIESTNKIYAGIHWSDRNKHKDQYRAIPFKKVNIQDFPVDVHYHFMSDCRTMDSSNLTYCAKLIEDCLVKSGVLPDDNQKHVKHFTTSYEKSKDNLCLILIRSHIPLDRDMINQALGK